MDDGEGDTKNIFVSYLVRPSVPPPRSLSAFLASSQNGAAAVLGPSIRQRGGKGAKITTCTRKIKRMSETTTAQCSGTILYTIRRFQ